MFYSLPKIRGWQLAAGTLTLALLLVAGPRLHRYQQRQRAVAAARVLAPTLREGGVIFHTSISAQSRAIQLATHSPYSYCGLLTRRGPEWLVVEAVQSVCLTPLARWVARGQGGHFVVMRLRDADATLTPAAGARLRAAWQPLLGRPYDLAFSWSDERMYCSKLIWKVYNRELHRQLGTPQHLGDFDLRHPAVRAALRARYGPHLPLSEPVVSPAALFYSPVLIEVAAQ